MSLSLNMSSEISVKTRTATTGTEKKLHQRPGKNLVSLSQMSSEISVKTRAATTGIEKKLHQRPGKQVILSIIKAGSIKLKWYTM